MADIVVRLQQLCASPAHTFWPDEVSLLDPAVVIFRHVQGPRQLTDIYLLTLAVHRRGRLVTFDAGITVEAVAGARRANLVVIGFEAPIA